LPEPGQSEPEPGQSEEEEEGSILALLVVPLDLRRLLVEVRLRRRRWGSPPSPLSGDAVRLPRGPARGAFPGGRRGVRWKACGLPGWGGGRRADAATGWPQRGRPTSPPRRVCVLGSIPPRILFLVFLFFREYLLCRRVLLGFFCDCFRANFLRECFVFDLLAGIYLMHRKYSWFGSISYYPKLTKRDTE
jgi:hypothetical protein